VLRNSLLNLGKKTILRDIPPECAEYAEQCNDTIEDISKCSAFIDWLQFLLQLLVEFSRGASNRVEEGMSLRQQSLVKMQLYFSK
jgi:hypothetical protein